MKNLIFTIFFGVLGSFFLFSFSQTPKPPFPPLPRKNAETKNDTLSIKSEKYEIKLTMPDGQKVLIPSMAYSVPTDFKIISSLVDPSSENIFLFLQKFSRYSEKEPVLLVNYNFVKNTILWKRRCKNQSGFLNNDNIILTNSSKHYDGSAAINCKTGDIVWKTDANVYLRIADENIAFTGSLTAVDLISGQNIWSRKVKNAYGWLEALIYDSVMLASIDGLHKFNLKNGSGWDYNHPTGNTDVLPDIGGRIMAGYLGVTVSTFDDENEVDYGMASNILKIDERVFFSAQEHLICKDFNTGRTIWQIKLPEDKTGSVFLFRIGKNLGLINKGSCLYKNSVAMYGYPYLLILDINSGAIRTTLDIKTIYPITDYVLKDSLIYIVSNRDLMIISSNLQVIAKRNFYKDTANYNRIGDYQYAFGDPGDYFYLGKGSKSGISVAPSINNGDFPVVSTKGMVVYDRNLKETNWIPINELYRSYATFSHYMVIRPFKENLSRRIILDTSRNFEVIGKTDLPGSKLLHDGRILMVPEINTFSIFNISDIVK